MEKKTQVQFDIRDLLPIGFLVMVLGLGMAYGLDILGDLRDDMTDGSAEELAANQTITAVAKIPAKLGTLVSVILAAVVIGTLVVFLYQKFA